MYWARHVLVDQALRGGGMRSTECPSGLISINIHVSLKLSSISHDSVDREYRLYICTQEWYVPLHGEQAVFEDQEKRNSKSRNNYIKPLQFSYKLTN